jgi:hypothetical protein
MIPFGAAQQTLRILRADPLPWYPKAVVIAVAALVLALAIIRPLRTWAFTVDLRYLIGFHVIRFVGFYFLFLYSRHELPYNFAVLGGWGDIIVALLAIVVIFFAVSGPAVALGTCSGLRTSSLSQ